MSILFIAQAYVALIIPTRSADKPTPLTYEYVHILYKGPWVRIINITVQRFSS